MELVCNICGSTDFKDFGATVRKNALCVQCGSLERHRALHYVLASRGLLSGKLGVARCLQLAPEKVTYDYLEPSYGTGYVSADLSPERYKHAQCLKLELPNDFTRFPKEYFDLIVHNHVLEHIPGNFKSHIDEFYRLLKIGGVMTFTIPDFNIAKGIKTTIDGGEFLASDEERLKVHGQKDHLKTFGTDLLDHLQSKFASVELLADQRNAEHQELISKHNAKGIVFYCAK